MTKLPETSAEQASRRARFDLHRQTINTLKAHREQAEHRIADIDAILQGKAKGRKDKAIEPAARELIEKERRELEARVGIFARDIEHADFFTPAEPVAFAVHDSLTPNDMRITIRGNAHALGDVVRGFVRVVCQKPAASIPSVESGRRQLADWIAQRRQSADRRVAVNRIWQRLIRRGDRALGRLLRQSRRAAHAPRATRRTRSPVRRRRLVTEAADSPPGVKSCVRHEQQTRQPVKRG